MGEETPGTNTSTAGAVFLSYASQDQAAAQRICDALRAAGVEVWLDKSELRGGDAWDATIRKQIKTCALFVPVISRSTHARSEGYFRLEWKLAVDRSHLMAGNKAFLLPVVIDDTREDDDAVPERFREVQWTRLPEGHTSQAFAARVRRLLSPDERTAALTDRAPDGADPARPNSTTAAAMPRRLLWTIFAAAIFVVAFIAIDRFVLPRRLPATAATPATAAAPPATAPADSAPSSIPLHDSAVSEHSIAVLPFVDMSEKHDQEYFSDGLAEELLDMLAKTPGLHVIARTSSFYFKGKQATVPEIGRALAVANLLEGSVRKSGNHLRVTTQLVRADNGEHLWSETYDRDQADVFKIQDDIARAVVDKLRLTLLGNAEQHSATVTANPVVHNLYLQGRYLLAFDTPEDLAKADDTFHKALQIDPAYAPAWVGLASVAVRQVANGYGSIEEGIARQGKAAQKAVELDPNLADGYVQQGFWREISSYDWRGARQDFDHALQLEPSSSNAQFAMAHLTATVGNIDESVRLYQKLVELDPLNLLQRRYLGRALYYAGRLDEAEAAIRQVMAISPTLPAAHYELGRILLARGHVPEAVTEFENEKSGWGYLGLPLGYHAAGRTADANAALQRLLQDTIGVQFQVAEAEACFGNLDQAFDWLDRAVQFHDPGIQWLRGDPLLRNLTKDPRYAALLRRVNLPN
jgi:TolB-like protein/tetratricopeptide (TPR) repeat protein